jgi:hypothetical protein
MTRDRRDRRKRKATARPGRDAPPRGTPGAVQPAPAVGSRGGRAGAPSGTCAGELERSAGRSGPGPAIPWSLVGALAILPLLWASRSPTLGVPVADDYLFLSRLAFERPLDFFGPMGAANYWRPVSRQLYYLLVGPGLLRAPWVATLLAVLLLLALYAVLYRLARRGFSPPLSAAIACFPLLSEPARVLLAWASASQHLLGALFAALAAERAVAGGLFVSGLAALLALFSNEAAFLVLPALPLIGGSAPGRERRSRAGEGSRSSSAPCGWRAMPLHEREAQACREGRPLCHAAASCVTGTCRCWPRSASTGTGRSRSGIATPR